jgi:hypothetical protein
MTPSHRWLRNFALSLSASLTFALAVGCTSSSLGSGDAGRDVANGTGGVGTGGVGTGGVGTGGVGTGGTSTGGVGTGGTSTGGVGTGGTSTGGVGTGGTSTGGVPFSVCNELSSGAGDHCTPVSINAGQGGNANGGASGSANVIAVCSNPTSLLRPANESELRTLLSRKWTICDGSQPLFCRMQCGINISHADRFDFTACTPAGEQLTGPTATGTVTYCASTVALQTQAGQVTNNEVVIGAGSGDKLILILNSGPNETRYVSN